MRYIFRTLVALLCWLNVHQASGNPIKNYRDLMPNVRDLAHYLDEKPNPVKSLNQQEVPAPTIFTLADADTISQMKAASVPGYCPFQTWPLVLNFFLNARLHTDPACKESMQRLETLVN